MCKHVEFSVPSLFNHIAGLSLSLISENNAKKKQNKKTKTNTNNQKSRYRPLQVPFHPNAFC